MPFITINSRTLHYLDVGKGPALLMGHNYLASHAVWREQVRVLSRNYRCIVPDLWGHGDSAAVPNHKVSLRSLAEDYWVLMQALDIESYSVCCLSVGGMWGIQMALDYPKSVNALVLISPGIGDVPMESQAYYLELLNQVDSQRFVPEQIVEQLIPLFFSGHTRNERHELTREFKDNLVRVKGEKLSTLVNMGRDILKLGEALEGLERLMVPTLILAGESGKICSPEQSIRFSKKIPGADLRMIPKAGHMSCLEQPDIVNNYLQEFFGRVYA